MIVKSSESVPMWNEINEFEPEYQKLSDEELKAKTETFKTRMSEATRV